MLIFNLYTAMFNHCKNNIVPQQVPIIFNYMPATHACWLSQDLEAEYFREVICREWIYHRDATFSKILMGNHFELIFDSNVADIDLLYDTHHERNKAYLQVKGISDIYDTYFNSVNQINIRNENKMQ